MPLPTMKDIYAKTVRMPAIGPMPRTLGRLVAVGIKSVGLETEFVPGPKMQLLQ